MPVSDAKKRANKKYNISHIATLSVKYQKTDPIFDHLNAAARKLGISKAEYIRKALYHEFSIDGIETPEKDQD